MQKKDHFSDSLFFIGSINQPGPWFHATGEGLTLCFLDESTGDIKRITTYPEIENPIWLTSINSGLWVATERYLNNGEINFFSIGDDYSLTAIGPTGNSSGGAVCHISLTADEKTMFVTSFLGGVSVHSINMNHEVAPPHQVTTYQGHGPKKIQKESHPHQAIVTPDGKFLYVCDLGSDRIWLHAVTKTGHQVHLGQAVEVNLPAGSGPRHMVFHPALALLYVLGQLDGQVYIYIYIGTNLNLLAIHNSLSTEFNGEPEAAAIKWHPSGKTLYISNRNGNTITVFLLTPNGDLKHAGCFSTKGKAPRDFLISKSGAWLIVLNHDSDTLIPFEINPKTGLPTGISGTPFICGCAVCGIFPTK